MEWYEHTDNVTHLGSALCDAGFEVKQLQAFYEKPYHWSNEWLALNRGGQELLERVLNGEVVDV